MDIMIQYWNPKLRVFEFPRLDASPTVEEYEMLLGRSRCFLQSEKVLSQPDTSDVSRNSPTVLQRHHQFPLGSSHPFKRFNNTNFKPVTLPEWSKLFREINPKNFGVKCCLYDRNEEVMHACGEYQNLVLMGPKGCITFTPALVLGQLNWGMNPVTSQQLSGFVFLYKDKNTSKEVLNEVRRALHNIRFYGKNELGEHRAFYTEEYKVWRKERMTSKNNVQIIMPKEKEGPSQNEINLQRRIKILEGKLEESRNIIERGSFCKEKLNKLNPGLKEEMASLKNDYARLSSLIKIRIATEVREIKDLEAQLRARDRIIFNPRNEKKKSFIAVKELRTEMEKHKASATEAWEKVDECEDSIRQGLIREEQYRAIVDDQAEIRHMILEDMNREISQLTNQVRDPRQAYDQLMGESIASQHPYHTRLRDRQVAESANFGLDAKTELVGMKEQMTEMFNILKALQNEKEKNATTEPQPHSGSAIPIKELVLVSLTRVMTLT
ncbi:unnamed protein product [Lupinus luteus]|uniref:DUF7745 domain-containing protein n=1 Tax=Lupinus luteus TaxID=3873 RepID=A0AAV1WBJ1_LUPLU